MMADKRLFLILLAVNAIGGLAAVWTLQVETLGIDDAYIYFVYAKNYLLSGEFVYNLGGERVEGFSSPAWMAVCIAAMWLSHEPQVPLFIFATILTTSISYLGVRYTESVINAEKHRKTTPFLHLGSWLFLAALFANPTWFTWNIASLMETPLWGMLIFMTMMRLITIVRSNHTAKFDPWLLPLLLGLLILSRPEAPLWVGWFLLGYGLALRAINYKLRQILLALLPAVIVVAICLFGLLAARLNYFGFLFANTYYAKMSPNFGYNLIEGFLYLLRFCADNGIAAFGVIIAIYSGVRLSCLLLPANYSRPEKLRSDTELFILSGTVCAGIAAALVTGGDKFGGYRFYQSLAPVLYLLILHYSIYSTVKLRDIMLRSPGLLNSFALAALIGLLLSNTLSASWKKHNHSNLQIEFKIAEQMRLSARLMNHIFLSTGTPLPRVAVIPAGGFKLDAEAETFDLMGLNLTTMAHSSSGREGIKNHAAFDPDIFWALKPQILGARLCSFENKPWKPDRFEWRVLKGLPGSDRFTSTFSYAHLRVRGDANWLCGYMDNKLIAELKLNEALQIHSLKDHKNEPHSEGVDQKNN